MKRLKAVYMTFLVFSVPGVVFSQTELESVDVIKEVAAPPEDIADAFILFTPSRATEIISRTDQVLEGSVDLVWGEVPETIIIPANIMIRPLEIGSVVEMYVRKFTNQDAYYPIYITTH